MTPHDEQRFAKMITDFVDGCEFARPFHLVVIDARGSVGVVRYGVSDIGQVCSGPAKANRLRMISPPTVTCISGASCASPPGRRSGWPRQSITTT